MFIFIPPVEYTEIVIIILVLIFSMFIAASEAALFSLSRFQIRQLRDKSRGTYKRIKTLLNDPQGLLLTILISDEVSSVIISSTIAAGLSIGWTPEHSWILKLFPDLIQSTVPEWMIQTFDGILISTPLLLVFCEMLPKTIGARLNFLFAPPLSGPLAVLYKLYWPIRTISAFVSRFFSSILGEKFQTAQHRSKSDKFQKEEFLLMAEDGIKSGAINEHELNLIRRVFEMEDTKVSDIMTPTTQTFCLDSNLSIQMAWQKLQIQNYARIPVIDRYRQIIGVLYRKDLLFERMHEGTGDTPITALIRKPLFVESDLSLQDLLKRMKAQKTHIAIVIDEHEKTIGHVTMNDLLEEIFEEVVVKP